MMPVQFDEINALYNSLRILFNDQAVYDIVYEAAELVGAEAVDRLGDIYPPDPPGPGAPSPLHTAKQWRWWWGSMHRIAKGEPVAESLRGWKAVYRKINGRKTLVIKSGSGYKRTGTLVRSISHKVDKKDRGVVIDIGPAMAREFTGDTAADYADFVIGLPPPAGPQARIHQGRWVPLVQAIEDMNDALLDMLEKEIVEGVRRRLRGRGSYTGSYVE